LYSKDSNRLYNLCLLFFQSLRVLSGTSNNLLICCCVKEKPFLVFIYYRWIPPISQILAYLLVSKKDWNLHLIGKQIYLIPYFPQLNPIEQLWKFMKYYWIEFDAYKSAKHMQDYMEKMLKLILGSYLSNDYKRLSIFIVIYNHRIL